MAQGNEGSSIIPPIVLLLAAVAGFIFSNSILSDAYNDILNSKLLFSIGGWEVINKSILLLVNDGLMAVFFLFVGLELKREIMVGELSNIKNAMLPIFGALGGMIAPALLYFALNPSGEVSNGWGIPMATDIAFALGIVAILGSRVPASLKILLSAIAIVDDLGAILVIAIFYTANIDPIALGLAFAFLGACFALNKLGFTKLSLYILLGFPMWYFMLKSGVHATIAGVMLAATIPLTAKNQKKNRLSLITDIFNKKASPLDSPAVFLEKSLVPWVSFLIVPVFAFCNSGVTLSSLEFGTVALGVILGLVLGKPLGILGAALLAKKLGVADLPAGTSWGQLAGLGCLAGIGFTMSLFISSLAFTSVDSNNEAKFAILIASLISGMIGTVLLTRFRVT